MSAITKPVLLDETGKAIVEQLKQMNSNASGSSDVNLSIVADEYSSKSTYAVDDLCLYKNVMYRCTTAITAAESWNADHWEKTSAGEEIEGLADNLAGLSFGQDSSGAWGYKIAGADTVIPFKKYDLSGHNDKVTQFTAPSSCRCVLIILVGYHTAANGQSEWRKNGSNMTVFFHTKGMLSYNDTTKDIELQVYVDNNVKSGDVYKNTAGSVTWQYSTLFYC